MRLLGAGGLRGGRTRLLRRLRSAAGAARRLLARLGRLCRLRGGRRIRRLVRLPWMARPFPSRPALRTAPVGSGDCVSGTSSDVPPLPPRSCRSGCRTCACSGQRIGRRTRPPVNTTATAPARSERISTAVQTRPQIVFRLMARPPEKRTLQQSLQRPHLRTTICPVSRTMRAEPPQAGLLTHASTAARAFSGFPNDRLSPCTRPPRIQRRYRPGFSPGSLSSPAARTAAEALEASIALSITRADFFVKPVPVCVSAFAKKIRISVLDRRARMVYNQSSPREVRAA